MKVLTAHQIREADAYTISHEPIASIALMERASSAFFKRFTVFYATQRTVTVFCGQGNNGGDGLAIARMLLGAGYKVQVIVLDLGGSYSSDFLVNHERFSGIDGARIRTINEIGQMPDTDSGSVIIDAIFGTGLSRPIEGLAAQAISFINDSGAETVAVDIPSGLYADKPNGKDDPIVKARRTFTFQCPKQSFFYCSNAQYAADWEVLDIGLDAGFIESQETSHYYIDKAKTSSILKERAKCSHKGTYGHALIWAGAYGKIGAAQLAAHGCLAAGAGLTTAYVPECGYIIFQTALPEVMVITDDDDVKLTGYPDLAKYNAMGIGPGIGTSLKTAHALGELLREAKDIPAVLDADALNIIAANKKLLSRLPRYCILTPHPKEFERLAGRAADDWQRQKMASDFAKEHHCILVLKGTYTSINLPDGNVWFNATGNPGMAKGGSGDALTGIITGLLAQNYDPAEAAILGVYLHGLAGDFAADKHGQWSMRATDLIVHLGEAFRTVGKA